MKHRNWHLPWNVARLPQRCPRRNGTSPDSAYASWFRIQLGVQHIEVWYMYHTLYELLYIEYVYNDTMNKHDDTRTITIAITAIALMYIYIYVCILWYTVYIILYYIVLYCIILYYVILYYIYYIMLYYIYIHIHIYIYMMFILYSVYSDIDILTCPWFHARRIHTIFQPINILKPILTYKYSAIFTYIGILKSVQIAW